MFCMREAGDDSARFIGEIACRLSVVFAIQSFYRAADAVVKARKLNVQ
jgi:hypothetical protein